MNKANSFGNRDQVHRNPKIDCQYSSLQQIEPTTVNYSILPKAQINRLMNTFASFTRLVKLFTDLKKLWFHVKPPNFYIVTFSVYSKSRSPFFKI